MIIVTGADGFIGSNTLYYLMEKYPKEPLGAVVSLGSNCKWKNLIGKKVSFVADKNDFIKNIQQKTLQVKPRAIIHLGARSSTTELDCNFLLENNFQYSQVLAKYCLKKNIRFIYASSAAIYGNEHATHKFSDSDDITYSLKPTNPYGFSKWLFDLWTIENKITSQVVGLRFFNVYGPNEEHKGDQSSPIPKFYKQLRESNAIRLFKPAIDSYSQENLKRDFVYVTDCIKVIVWFLENPNIGGIFNVGTGVARSWIEVANVVKVAIRDYWETHPSIEYIDMPNKLKEHYQYFTQADITKLRGVGCDVSFCDIETGVTQYIHDFLKQEKRR
jgi:ADP-L-glycero-D-manno-heptose 6-epimerase